MAKAHKTAEKPQKFELDPKRLGLTLGILKAGCLGIISLLAIVTNGWGRPLISVIGSLLVGYDATFMGFVIGLVWGFVLGFVFGYKSAWLYNKLA